MILSAIVAVEAKDIFASIIAFGIMGLELALAFLLLKAPDIAIVLLTLEMIVFMVFAAELLKRKAKYFPERDIFSSFTFIAFTILFIIVSLKAFIELPSFGEPLLKLAKVYCLQSLDKTGASNIVSAIIFNYRCFDSLIVIMVLLLTAIGIQSITEKKQ
jgi:multisubunit Na+/H+ antiporter MnhB subunit